MESYDKDFIDMEPTPQPAPEKEDKRKKTALENLRKGREKLLAMKKAGIIPQKKKGKAVQHPMVQIQDEPDTDSSSSESTDEEFTISRRKATAKPRKKHPSEMLLPNKAMEEQMRYMQTMIDKMQAQKKKSKARPKKQTIVQVMPPAPIMQHPVKTDEAEMLRRRIFGL
jgi:hypothetical protein